MPTASSQQIEHTVAEDLIALLDGASISNVIREQEDAPTGVASYVVVKVDNMRGNLPAGTIPTGFRQVDMNVEVLAHADDDTTGSVFNTLIAAVRTVIWDDAIIASLNAASTYNTYYGMMTGDDLPDMDGRWRVMALQFSLVMKPSKVT